MPHLHMHAERGRLIGGELGKAMQSPRRGESEREAECCAKKGLKGGMNEKTNE